LPIISDSACKELEAKNTEQIQVKHKKLKRNRGEHCPSDPKIKTTAPKKNKNTREKRREKDPVKHKMTIRGITWSHETVIFCITEKSQINCNQCDRSLIPQSPYPTVYNILSTLSLSPSYIANGIHHLHSV